jgi:hypothetical protein
MVFVYAQDDSGRFWVYDGHLYHHFFVEGSAFWYVRTQDFLPARAVGRCVTLDMEERQALEAEAARYNVRLLLFSSVEECTWYELTTPQDQFIIDRTCPAGFFYLERR